MQLLYGTTNQAKLTSMRRITKNLGISIIGLKEWSEPVPPVLENGKTPLANARLKARAYYDAFKIPVFSCDSGLFFDHIEDRLQPGTHVRRINGKELSDNEMIDYYANLARQHQGRLTGRYQNAVCFIYDREHIFECMDDSLSTEPFLLVSKPHPKRENGFPLDSLSVDLKTNCYFYDTGHSVDQSAIEHGFKNFFQRALAELFD